MQKLGEPGKIIYKEPLIKGLPALFTSNPFLRRKYMASPEFKQELLGAEDGKYVICGWEYNEERYAKLAAVIPAKAVYAHNVVLNAAGFWPPNEEVPLEQHKIFVLGGGSLFFNHTELAISVGGGSDTFGTPPRKMVEDAFLAQAIQFPQADGPIYKLKFDLVSELASLGFGNKQDDRVVSFYKEAGFEIENC